MRTSTTLQLKISATKKRLFDGFLPVEALSALALCGLFAIVGALVKVITLGGTYGVVSLDIPVLSAPLADQSTAGFRENAKSALDRSTVAVALTPREFIFGDLSAFTLTKDDVRNKFIIPHTEGSPQVDTLIEQIKSWQEERTRKQSIRPDELVVLIPDSRVPMNIVIQVSSLLRASGIFKAVMLAGGIE